MGNNATTLHDVTSTISSTRGTYGVDTPHYWEGNTHRFSIRDDSQIDMASDSKTSREEEFYWNSVLTFHEKMKLELADFEAQGFSRSDGDLVKELETKLKNLEHLYKARLPCAALMDSITKDMIALQGYQTLYQSRGRIYAIGKPVKKTVRLSVNSSF